MGLLNLCMKKNPFSRAVHFFLIVPCAVLTVMAAISLGSFVPLHLDIRDYEGSGAATSDLNTCILFATADNENKMVDYQPDNACDFTIWGQVAVGSLAVAMATVLFVKAFLGIKVFSWFVLIELLLSIAGFIFTLALGVVITVGLDDTCRAFQDINELDEDAEYMPCEDYRYAGNSGISFYSALNTVRVRGGSKSACDSVVA
jgi:hypothetical protein